MIDIKLIRENPELVKENIKKKFQDDKLALVDEVAELDEKSRAAKQEADDIRSERNKISKQIGALMGQGKKEEAEELKAQVAAKAERLAELEKDEAWKGCTACRVDLAADFIKGKLLRGDPDARNYFRG